VRRRRVLLRLVALLIVAALAAISWPYLWPGGKQPLQVAADAAKLPASTKVFGARVRLRLLTQEAPGKYYYQAESQGKVDHHAVQVSLDPRIGVRVDGGPQHEVVAKVLPDRASNFSYCVAQINVPRGRHVLTISQQLHREPPQAKAEFRFVGISPSTHELRQERQSASIVITRLHVGRLSGPMERWVRTIAPNTSVPLTQRFMVVETLVHVPAISRLKGRVYAGPSHCGWNISDDGGEWQCDNSPEPASLVDNAGHHTEGVACERWIRGPGAAFVRAAESQTLLEKGVGYISAKCASRLATRRANRAAQVSGYDTRVSYVFPLVGRVQKRYNFVTSVRLPPKPEDAAVVEFGNITVACP
jgi:hypothetical protein